MVRQRPSPISELERSVMLQRTLDNWDPAERPVHCSNCRFAVVFANNGNPPATYCKRGYGKVMDLWPLIRRVRPQQFSPASECPDFSSMDDD